MNANSVPPPKSGLILSYKQTQVRERNRLVMIYTLSPTLISDIRELHGFLAFMSLAYTGHQLG